MPKRYSLGELIEKVKEVNKEVEVVSDDLTDKKHQYSPKIIFKGSGECFTKVKIDDKYV